MGCQDCFQTQQQLNEGFAIVQAEAKSLAIKQQANVFIFQTSEGWRYMVEEAAIKSGIQPTGGVVSPIQRPDITS